MTTNTQSTIRATFAAIAMLTALAGPLYAALSGEQKRTADELMAEHLRGMRRAGL